MAKTLTWIGYTADAISLATAGAAVGGPPTTHGFLERPRALSSAQPSL